MWKYGQEGLFSSLSLCGTKTLVINITKLVQVIFLTLDLDILSMLIIIPCGITLIALNVSV